MCEREQFENEFIARLDGKITDADLEVVMRVMQQFTGEFEINRRQTNLVPYGDDYPPCFKAYMVAKKIEGRTKDTLEIGLPQSHWL